MKKKKYIKIAAVAIACVLFGYLIGNLGNNEPEPLVHEHPELSEDTVWTCSMHPQIRQPEPGDCPLCGMDLIPVKEGTPGENSPVVEMSDYAMKLANFETIEVGSGTAESQIRLNGVIAVDERLTYTQPTHVPGRIEQLLVNFTGEEVRRGQPLARIYSPEMITAQEELLQAYAIRESNPRLFEAAKQKLKSWKISENQIQQILENGEPLQRFTIFSDVNGIVTEKLAEPGDYVERGAPLFQIADLSKVWVLFDVYESEMRNLREGSTVQFTVASLPGEEFTGKIDFVNPVVDPQSRVATARIVIENPEGKLKPGMFVTGIAETPMRETNSEEITVPQSAVLWTGERSVVYVKDETFSQNGFVMREIILGSEVGDSYIITEGLQPGDKVVVNGAFAVDAAAQLAGKPSMMNQNGIH